MGDAQVGRWLDGTDVSLATLFFLSGCHIKVRGPGPSSLIKRESGNQVLPTLPTLRPKRDREPVDLVLLTAVRTWTHGMVERLR